MTALISFGGAALLGLKCHENPTCLVVSDWQKCSGYRWQLAIACPLTCKIWVNVLYSPLFTQKKNSNLSAYIEFVFITEDPSGMRLCSHPSGFWRASTMTGGNCQRRPLESCRRENCKKLEQPRLLQQMCYWQMWNFPEVSTLEYVVGFFPSPVSYCVPLFIHVVVCFVFEVKFAVLSLSQQMTSLPRCPYDLSLTHPLTSDAHSPSSL